MGMSIELIFLVLAVSCNSTDIPMFQGSQSVKSNYKVTKYTYSRYNGSDIMDQKPFNFHLIPMDFLCEFCQVVIMKLKERQAMENDFEQKVRNECINYSKNSSSLCDVVNRVNLDRLKTDDSKKICKTQQMCNDQSGATTHEPGPPSASPEQQISQRKPGDEPERIDIDEKRLNATLHVEDISSYN